jgi:DNA-directed RNA polymerase subunit RPC12/RpoP
VIYAVCTGCSFLRVYSREAEKMPRLEACPACGGELIVKERAGRFPPAYVSRISMELLGSPSLPLGDSERPA